MLEEGHGEVLRATLGRGCPPDVSRTLGLYIWLCLASGIPTNLSLCIDGDNPWAAFQLLPQSWIPFYAPFCTSSSSSLTP